jgi:hypothetical protein
MQIARDAKPERPFYNPDIMKEFDHPRFIWEIMNSYHVAFGKKQVNDHFWARQTAALEGFDQRNPGMHRPAGKAPAERPRLNPPQLQFMVASGSTKRDPILPVHQRPFPSPIPQPSPVLPRESPPPASVIAKHSRPLPSRTPRPAQQKLSSAGPSKVGKPAVVSLDMPDAGVQHVDKGKGRMMEVDVDENGDYVDEGDDMYVDEDDDEDYPAPAPAPAPASAPKKRKGNGKGKEVIPAQNDQEGPHSAKRRPSPKPSGKVRNPACARCIKGGRTCQEQAGLSTACMRCARIKMKCHPVTDGEPEKIKVKVPVLNPVSTSKPPGLSKEPASSKQPGPSKEPASKNRRAPVKSKREPAAKKQPAPAKSDPLPAPKKRPAPAVSQPVATTPVNIQTMIPGTIRQPLERTFEELDASDRKL